MQKLDLLKNLKTIAIGLNAQQIYTKIGTGYGAMIATPAQPWNGKELVSILVDAKSTYDNLIRHQGISALLKILNAEDVYSTAQFSQLIATVSAIGQVQQLQFVSNLLRTFNLHSDILHLRETCEKLLVADPKVQRYETPDSGVTVFQIATQESPLSLTKLTKILKELTELLEYMAIIYKTSNDAEIVLLDSGSDKSVAIKTTIELAASMLTLFKDGMDYFLNHKHHKTKLELESMVDSFDALRQIKKARADEVITEEKAQEYSAIVLRKTDDLLDMKVAPKQIVDAVQIQRNVDLLQTYTSIRQIPRYIMSENDTATGERLALPPASDSAPPEK